MAQPESSPADFVAGGGAEETAAAADGQPLSLKAARCVRIAVAA